MADKKEAGWARLAHNVFRHTDGRVSDVPPMEKVMIRSRLPEEDAFGDPWDATRRKGREVPGFIALNSIPETGSQFMTPDNRAFAVMSVERRYDLGETHLFCVEYPREDPPVPENKA